MDFNLVLLCGRVVGAPERRTDEFGRGGYRVLLRVRVERPVRRIEVIPVTVDVPVDELIPETRVWVAGTIVRRFWESYDGRRSAIEVLAHQVRLVDADMTLVCGG
jgi:hypothetical protein